MFFTFPIQATADNWLSETLTREVLSILNALDQETDPPEFLENAAEEHRAVLSRYPAVKQRWEALKEALSGLTVHERGVVREAVLSQNDIPGILNDRRACVQCREGLPLVHERAEHLFRTCFERLGHICSPGQANSIRDSQYAQIFPRIPSKCCPFCGMELFEPFHPGVARPQIDHYLPITIYPFAGVNLRNLVPMGSACNSAYKRNTDILYDESGNRTSCFDPYGNIVASVSMERSRILTDPGAGPTWIVDVQPSTEEVAQWDRVFNIRTRLMARLISQYKEWLIEIGGYLHKKGRRAEDRNELLQTLRDFGQTCKFEALHAIAIIKGAFVELLIRDLEDEANGGRMQRFLSAAFS